MSLSVQTVKGTSFSLLSVALLFVKHMPSQTNSFQKNSILGSSSGRLKNENEYL